MGENAFRDRQSQAINYVYEWNRSNERPPVLRFTSRRDPQSELCDSSAAAQALPENRDTFQIAVSAG